MVRNEKEGASDKTIPSTYRMVWFVSGTERNEGNPQRHRYHLFEFMIIVLLLVTVSVDESEV